MTTDRIRPLTVVARENSMGLTQAYEHIKSGRLRIVKLGHKTMVRDSDWNEFLASLPSATAPAPKVGRYLNRMLTSDTDNAA